MACLMSGKMMALPWLDLRKECWMACQMWAEKLAYQLSVNWKVPQWESQSLDRAMALQSWGIALAHKCPSMASGKHYQNSLLHTSAPHHIHSLQNWSNKHSPCNQNLLVNHCTCLDTLVRTIFLNQNIELSNLKNLSKLNFFGTKLTDGGVWKSCL